jgi:hypothetical protein
VKNFWCTLLLLFAWNAGANELTPLAGLYYDNMNEGGVTLGVAHLGEHGERFDSGYYADLTYNRYARIISAGYASVGEWGLDRAGFAFMQTTYEGQHQNYLGISFTFSLVVSFKLGLYSQVSDPADLRPMLALGVGI